MSHIDMKTYKCPLYYPPEVRSINYCRLPSCQSFTIMHFKCLNCAFTWVVKMRNTSEAVFRPQYAPWTSYHTDYDPTGLGQYNGLEAYCGPYTASSVFLMLFLFDNSSSSCSYLNLKIGLCP